MAFETIRGESGVDFIGTDGVDSLFALNETGSITVDASGANDIITVANTSGVVGTATVKGGAGDDTIAFALAGDSNETRLSSSSVNGGAGDDDITLEGAVTSVVRGNEDDDDFTLRGNYTGSTLNGNGGNDTFDMDAATSISLQSTKILGGNDNDGAMVFDDGTGAVDITSVVDSTINGSKGNDAITLGIVTTATNFTVFGGQGNDVITSNNTAAVNNTDAGIVYSGDKGDDTITTNSANDSISGGEGNDLITSAAGTDTVDGGAGDDVITDGAGNDTTTLGDGDDTYNDGAGNDTITGGGGADTYAFDVTATDDNVYTIAAVTDSAAALSGTTRTFDTIGVGFTAAIQSIDISAISESLLGEEVDNNTTVTLGANSTVVPGTTIASTADTFAELRTALSGGALLTASSAAANDINIDFVTVIGDGGASALIDGTYLIVNNTNAILDSGDLMFRISGAAGTTLDANMAALDDYTAIGAGGTAAATNAWIL